MQFVKKCDLVNNVLYGCCVTVNGGWWQDYTSLTEDKYSPLFITCHFSMNCVDNILSKFFVFKPFFLKTFWIFNTNIIYIWLNAQEFTHKLIKLWFMPRNRIHSVHGTVAHREHWTLSMTEGYWRDSVTVYSRQNDIWSTQTIPCTDMSGQIVHFNYMYWGYIYMYLFLVIEKILSVIHCDSLYPVCGHCLVKSDWSATKSII